MATYSDPRAVHPTLTASTVDTVTITGEVASGLLIVNRTGAAEIYFTAAANGVTPATPTVGGNGTYVLPAAIGSFILVIDGVNAEVSLISSGAEAYSVVLI